MTFPFPIPPDVHRLAVLGTAKNTGKTTTLVALLDHLQRSGAPPPALLSIGIDGERNDAFSGASKPPIPAPAGALVATAELALQRSDASVTILESTPIRTPMGQLLIARVDTPGPILLAGVRHRADLLVTASRLEALGASLVLIDGAFDRLAAADPQLSHAVLLATGAAIGLSPEAVATHTLNLVRRLQLPQAPPDLLHLLTPDTPVPTIHRDGTPHPLSTNSLLLPFPKDPSPFDAPATALAVPGALTPRAVDRLLAAGLRHTPLLLLDPTRAHLQPAHFQRLARQHVPVYVRQPVRILGISANPFAPGHTPHDPHALCHALHRAIPHLPIADLHAGITLPPA